MTTFDVEVTDVFTLKQQSIRVIWVKLM